MLTSPFALLWVILRGEFRSPLAGCDQNQATDERVEMEEFVEDGGSRS
jgi:hypothetical protein